MRLSQITHRKLSQLAEEFNELKIQFITATKVKPIAHKSSWEYNGAGGWDNGECGSDGYDMFCGPRDGDMH